MVTALNLLLLQGLLGAFDTLFYHERMARLPARAEHTRPELRLHAARDFVYAVLFLTLPFVAWHGAWALVVAGLLLAEIGITLADFAVEDEVRAPFGGVPKGERATHTVMAIVYGAFLATFAPILLGWWGEPTGFVGRDALSDASTAVFLILGLGVLVSGIRDLLASFGIEPIARETPSAQPVKSDSRFLDPFDGN